MAWIPVALAGAQMVGSNKQNKATQKNADNAQSSAEQWEKQMLKDALARFSQYTAANPNPAAGWGPIQGPNVSYGGSQPPPSPSPSPGPSPSPNPQPGPSPQTGFNVQRFPNGTPSQTVGGIQGGQMSPQLLARLLGGGGSPMAPGMGTPPMFPPQGPQGPRRIYLGPAG